MRINMSGCSIYSYQCDIIPQLHQIVKFKPNVIKIYKTCGVLSRRSGGRIDYCSEIDEIYADAGVFERAIIGFIKSNAPPIFVSEVRASGVEVV